MEFLRFVFLTLQSLSPLMCHLFVANKGRVHFCLFVAFFFFFDAYDVLVKIQQICRTDQSCVENASDKTIGSPSVFWTWRKRELHSSFVALLTNTATRISFRHSGLCHPLINPTQRRVPQSGTAPNACVSALTSKAAVHLIRSCCGWILGLLGFQKEKKKVAYVVEWTGGK